MTIGGGNNLGSTPTEILATFRPVAVVVATSKLPTRLAFAEHEPMSKGWRGVGEVESLRPSDGSAGGANRTQKDRIKQGIDPPHEFFCAHERTFRPLIQGHNGLDKEAHPWRKTAPTVADAA